MITEDYISFETAKLLKEKGFDINTLMVYNQNGSFMPDGAIEDTYQVFYAAPTLQMAMKWIREVHDAIVNVFYDKDKEKWCAEYYRMLIDDYTPIGYHNTYEEAYESAIKYCLKYLI